VHDWVEAVDLLPLNALKLLLGETMLDASTLREMLEKNF
jgi:hypothetical protein